MPPASTSAGSRRPSKSICAATPPSPRAPLWGEKGLARGGKPIRFQTRSGQLTCIQSEGRIELDFPAETEQETAPSPELADALGAVPVYVGRNRFDILAQFPSEEA